MARGILPTRRALQYRGIQVEGSCVCCGSELETMEHVFFTCPVAKECWQLSGLTTWVEGLPGFGVDSRRWIFELINAEAEFQVQKTVAMLWALWRERNTRYWQGKTSPHQIIVRLCDEELKEWRTIHHKDRSPRPREESVCIKWHPPAPGFVKCNTDIALFEGGTHYGAGLVIRDENSHVLHYVMQKLVATE
ncbi:hypothetical protein LINPERPRIM_LOCUS33210 [Linum perenne]